jgi:imidazolonepropionase-like amidohydrolase
LIRILPILFVVLAGCAPPPDPAQQPAPAVTVAHAPYVPDSGSIAVRCGRLIDGFSSVPRQGVTVIIRNGRIAELTTAAAPADLPSLDLPGHTCLPGLIDMHTHITDRPLDTADLRIYYTMTREEQFARSRQHAAATLEAGFTTLRNVGTYIAWADRDIRDAINKGETVGPRMQIVGYYLTIPGGGGDLRIPGVPEAAIPARVRGGVSRGPEEFRRNAERAIAGGADLLKVIASGAVLAYGSIPGEPEMAPEEIKVVVEVAHAAGLKLAAHAHGARSIKEAILAGADTIEHASLIDDADIALAREHRVALSMDIYNGDYTDTEGRRQKWPEEFLRKNLETTEAQREGFTRAHATGVPIVYGTDAGVFPHGLNARQFPIMVQRGMRPMEAIQSATSLAAHYMGWDDRVGSLKPGAFGDLIAVEGDPLENITRLQNVAVVIKGGLVFKLQK